MFGGTGVSRTSIDYVSIIWATGFTDLVQTLICFAYVILMGAFYYRVIDQSPFMGQITVNSTNSIFPFNLEMNQATVYKTKESDPVLVVLP
jgi:hypothetical protein